MLSPPHGSQHCTTLVDHAFVGRCANPVTKATHRTPQWRDAPLGRLISSSWQKARLSSARRRQKNWGQSRLFPTRLTSVHSINCNSHENATFAHKGRTTETHFSCRYRPILPLGPTVLSGGVSARGKKGTRSLHCGGSLASATSETSETLSRISFGLISHERPHCCTLYPHYYA